MSEWTAFNRFDYGGQSFKPVDVPGDGSCFYHALVASNALPVSDYLALRIRSVY
jgi:hypothetical protein